MVRAADRRSSTKPPGAGCRKLVSSSSGAKSKMGAPKNASLSLLTCGLSSNRLSSLLRLPCSCAVFAVRGFHCFAFDSCCVCAAIATISRVSSFNDFICSSVGGRFPGRFETHRVHLLVFGLLAWTRAYVATKSFERDEDEDIEQIFAIGRPRHAGTTVRQHRVVYYISISTI